MSFRSIKHTLSAASILVAAMATSAAMLLPATAYASPPTISSFSCSNLPYGPEFVCIVAYNSNLPATVTWSGADGTATAGAGVGYFFGQCANGDSVMVRVTVTNADGTATRSTKRYRCIVG